MFKLYLKLCLVFIFIMIHLLGNSQHIENPFQVYHNKQQLDKKSLQNKKSETTKGDITNNSKKEQSPNPFKVGHEDTSSFTKGQNDTLKEIIKDRIDNPVADSAIISNTENNNPFQTNTNDGISSSIRTNNKNSKIKNKKSSSNSEIILDKSNKKERKSDDSKFIFWILFFTIFLFAILINYKRSFVLNSYRGILNENYLKLIKREENNGFSNFFISLFVVFLLSFSSFIYLYLSKIKAYGSGIIFFIKIIAVLFLIYFIRVIALKLIAYIFDIKLPIEKFLFTILYYNVLLGICLIVVNVCFAFGSGPIVQFSIISGAILIVGLLLIRYVRGILLSIQHSFLFKIQFIFYLCAVEIAPFVFFTKLLGEYSISFI